MNIISPKDIKKTDFKKTLRGYDPIEVDAFLETVSLRYERLIEENSELIEKVKAFTSDLEVYKENELTLQKAIIKAQDLAEEIVSAAKKKAENIVKEAELISQRLLLEIDKDVLTKKQELEELKLRNDKLVEDVKLFFMEKLNEMDEFIKHRNVYKMEIAKMEDSETEHESDEAHEPHLKKISINTGGTNFPE
jgi:cell division initiation protein